MLRLRKKKSAPRFIRYLSLVERYPELYQLSFYDDVLIIKLKHASRYYGFEYRYWPVSDLQSRYFFDSRLIDRLLTDYCEGF